MARKIYHGQRKNELEKQEKRNQIIQQKKQYYKQILQKIFKKYRVYNILRIDILGITETGPGEGDILYKILKRGDVTEIKELSIRKETDQTMFKITTPEEYEIKASTDFWLFEEDTED